MPGPGAPIIGREAELAAVRGLVEPAPRASEVLLVTGDAGMGKTVLLADAADRARSAGLLVLRVTGRESESRLAFAGLHQLLRPVLSRAAALPGRQAQALLGALGLATDPAPPDPLLTGVAVLTLLSDLSEHEPVLVVADDAHWLDRSSLDALAFVSSPLDAERVVLLLGARGPSRPPASTGDSRSCTWSRCRRPTPAACWTGSLARRAVRPARRCSPRPPAIPWR